MICPPGKRTISAAGVRIIGVILPLLAACGSHRTASVIADEMAACIPSDTVVLAGLRLERIRHTALYPALPATWRALLEPLQDATDLVVAYNGRDLLAIAGGRFASAPPGARLLGPTLALGGSAAAMRAATAQRATGRTGAPRLLAHAKSAAGKPIWLAVQGGVALPLPGNFGNFNRVLKLVDYATLTADINSRVEIRAIGVCQTADDGRQLEESVRALVSLAAAGTRDPELAALFQSIQVTRDGATVQMAMTASVPAVEKLMR
jgi:hypothetical protein